MATETQSNEITAIPKLLDLLDLRGATVTIEAMGCQKAIAEKMVDGGADYILALKDNHPTLHREVELFFDAACSEGFADGHGSRSESVDGGHGRIEARRVVASDDIGWMAEKSSWKHLRSVVMVESERMAEGKTSVERRYYLSSLAAEAQAIGEKIRGHWSIENELHWVLDMAFNEDRSRIRRGKAPDNFALLRKIALGLLKHEKTSRRGLLGKRKRAGWDEQYLLKVLEAGARAE